MKLIPIKPKGKLFDIPRIERAVKQGMRAAGEEAVSILEGYTKGWSKPPTFEVVAVSDGVIVGTDDEIFGYVDEGTKPHVIVPRKAKVLRFNPHGGNGASGGAVFTKRVNHPGTAPRDYTGKALKQVQDALPTIIASYLDPALGAD